MFGKNTTDVTLGPSRCIIICLTTDDPFDHLVKVISTFLYYKATVFPFIINKRFMEKYLETVQISCFLSNFYPLILAITGGSC